MKTYERIRVVNPIITKLSDRFGIMRTWSQFLKNWEKASEPWELEGLLHKGYDLTFETAYRELEYNAIDRTVFYLSCADGWQYPFELHIQGEDAHTRIHRVRHEKGVVDLTSSEMKEVLVQKAMKMLCQYEFKPWADNYPKWRDPDIHMTYFTSADLLPSLMHFFSDVGDDNRFTYYNMQVPQGYPDMSHIHRQIYEFVMRLIKTILIWSESDFRWKKGSYSRDEAEALRKEGLVASEVKRFNIAKAWAVEMLASMGDLDLLLKMETLDDVIISTLKKIELECYMKGRGEKRRVKNHKEALQAGSRCAWFLERYFTTHGLNFDGTPIEKSKPSRR